MGDHDQCFIDYNLFGELHIPASFLKQALETPDAIQVAAEMGRLDVLMIMLAITAFAGFYLYRNVVDRAARAEVKEVCPSVVASYLQGNPHIFRQALEANRDILKSVINDQEATPDLSSEIAVAMEGGDELEPNNSG